MKILDGSGDRFPIAHEELRIGKRAVETGRVRVATHVDERTEWVREELAREDVDVEWVEIGQETDRIPEVRTEGDTLIIPLYEEVVVVEKRLVVTREIRLTRRTSTEPFEAPVPLRRLEAEVTRHPPRAAGAQGRLDPDFSNQAFQPRTPQSRTPPIRTPQSRMRTPMPRTLTAFYDSREHAEQARGQLIAAGVQPNDIDIHAAEGGESQGGSGQSSSGQSGGSGGGFMQSVKNFFMPDEDRHAYGEGMSRGGVVLTARPPEGQEDRIIEILDRSGAVDFDERQQTWRGEGWQDRSQMQQGQEAREQLSGDREATIPIAEERLHVGKREVDRGSVRVRSYVSEQPVNEQVQLTEEHVNIERRPVGERIQGDADGIFEERSFEVSERAEEPMVDKETVVTDELHVSKETEQRTEKIQDSVRRTEVDVDDQRDGGRRRDDPTPPRGF